MVLTAALTSALTAAAMRLSDPGDANAASGVSLSRIYSEENVTQAQLAALDKRVRAMATSVERVRAGVGTDAVLDNHKGSYLLLTGVYQCVVHNAGCP